MRKKKGNRDIKNRTKEMKEKWGKVEEERMWISRDGDVNLIVRSSTHSIEGM